MRAGDWVLSSGIINYSATLHVFLSTFSNQKKLKIQKEKNTTFKIQALWCCEFQIVVETVAFAKSPRRRIMLLESTLRQGKITEFQSSDIWPSYSGDEKR